MVVVVRFQGPRANGCPNCTSSPALGVLQDKGHRVALVTDGACRAPGQIPAAIHCCPEASAAGRSRYCAMANGVCAARAVISSDRCRSRHREPVTPPPPPLGTGRECSHSCVTLDDAERGARRCSRDWGVAYVTIDQLMRTPRDSGAGHRRVGRSSALAETLVERPAGDRSHCERRRLGAITRCRGRRRGGGAGTVLDEAMWGSDRRRAGFIVSPG